MASTLSRQILIAALFFGIGAAGTYFSMHKPESTESTATRETPDHPQQESDRNRPYYKELPGRFRPVPKRSGAAEQTSDESHDIGDLGYAGGYEPSPEDTGVVFHAPDLALQGLNLAHDGSGPFATLMDMEGNTLHQWRYELSNLLSDEEIHAIARTMARVPDKFGYWRRIYPFPNGDLLAIAEDAALIKLDKDSNLIWSWRGVVHHDLWVDEDNGEIFVLTRKIHVMPRFSKVHESAEDFITVLDSEGNFLRETSIMEAVLRSNFNPLQNLSPRGGDLQHTNTIEVLDGSLASKSPAFARGNILLSLCRIDTILVVDPKSQKVVWSMAGPWTRQHQPTVLDNGNMLIFDNRGLGGNSKVMEFDPFSQKTVWAYRHSKNAPFSSLSCGSNQRLENGNTLITETDSGRAFEVNRKGKIVWEFLTPNRAGKDKELIATLFEVIRLPSDFFGNSLDE